MLVPSLVETLTFRIDRTICLARWYAKKMLPFTTCFLSGSGERNFVLLTDMAVSVSTDNQVDLKTKTKPKKVLSDDFSLVYVTCHIDRPDLFFHSLFFLPFDFSGYYFFSFEHLKSVDGLPLRASYDETGLLPSLCLRIKEIFKETMILKMKKFDCVFLLGDSSISMSCHRSGCGGALEKEEISIAFVSEKADYRRDEWSCPVGGDFLHRSLDVPFDFSN